MKNQVWPSRGAELLNITTVNVCTIMSVYTGQLIHQPRVLTSSFPLLGFSLFYSQWPCFFLIRFLFFPLSFLSFFSFFSFFLLYPLFFLPFPSLALSSLSSKYYLSLNFLVGKRILSLRPNLSTHRRALKPLALLSERPSQSSNYFEFIYVYSVTQGASFILLHVAAQFYKDHLLKKLSFLHHILLAPLSKIN